MKNLLPDQRWLSACAHIVDQEGCLDMGMVSAWEPAVVESLQSPFTDCYILQRLFSCTSSHSSLWSNAARLCGEIAFGLLYAIDASNVLLRYQ